VGFVISVVNFLATTIANGARLIHFVLANISAAA
jgi:hypothetical protein